MKEIIKLIIKYHFTLVFILIEIVCLSLIVRYNNYQRVVFTQNSSDFFGYISSVTQNIEDYFYLKEINKSLVEENTTLKNKLEYFQERNYTENKIDTLVIDSLLEYSYLNAKVVNATFNRTKNYLTLNKGKKDGIVKEMAVCNADGVVGLIQDMDEKFSIVIPLINLNSGVHGKIKRTNYYGSLKWDGKDYRYSNIFDIPVHIDVNVGDTIVTSGFSAIFPEDLLIGVVESVSDNASANFLNIRVKLAVDFKSINNVYIISSATKESRKRLEEANYDE